MEAEEDVEPTSKPEEEDNTDNNNEAELEEEDELEAGPELESAVAPEECQKQKLNQEQN